MTKAIVNLVLIGLMGLIATIMVTCTYDVYIAGVNPFR